ncbi:hydantoinase/oxoprolinase family protein [Amycolatopsis sp. Poz14]|uniref:hydantoinase/oxoprolinase family protein n=1 Tax=Amycolatopsis sp. Poz14 TaxID=1447705 RepID=UPI001EE8C900|nr:hydantoinase/oxoprolinase family protein [Amycolatopsis sp. Poz14]MCG3754780.1 hydantoinase/oxoprolinase family protein [Amycolatopsis sp. Poz14]
MPYKITVDTGGTFTDVVVTDADGRLTIGKAPTRERAFDGVRGGVEVAAAELGITAGQLLADTTTFVYSTTRSTNAILEGRTARTALLVTEGFPDILVLREGGKHDGFDLSVRYPEPYVPRALTSEIPERIDSEGDVVRRLDEDAVRDILRRLRAQDVEAVAVCLLWAIVNGAHERRVGELISEELPGIPYTLSHEVNPIVREYRRASTAAIDASLKPMMSAHLSAIAEDLAAAGFRGELMVATSFGGVLHLPDAAARPVDTVRSGPSMAPVAGLTFARAENDNRDVIVCDTGGTSFDVSLVRAGAVTFTNETWLGPKYLGHLTGTASVDIRSIGSGGGSIAWVDDGGLLRVGPRSAGADPGPACYGRGGTEPTVSDAACVLGYLDPDTFLGGRMPLDRDAADTAVDGLAATLGLSREKTAESVLTVANEHMVGAIQDITINEGVDPARALVVAGGGAAGLGIASIVRALGCSSVLMPRSAGALSATGGQFSDIVAEFTASQFADTRSWDFEAVNSVLKGLDERADEFAAGLRERGVDGITVDHLVEARYAYQVWELEVPVGAQIDDADGLAALRQAFDEAHERVFSVKEPGAPLECLTWKARLRAPVGSRAVAAVTERRDGLEPVRTGADRVKPAYFDGAWHDTTVVAGGSRPPGTVLAGPLIVEEPTSTLVVPPGARLHVTSAGNYLVEV